MPNRINKNFIHTLTVCLGIMEWIAVVFLAAAILQKYQISNAVSAIHTLVFLVFAWAEAILPFGHYDDIFEFKNTAAPSRKPLFIVLSTTIVLEVVLMVHL